MENLWEMVKSICIFLLIVSVLGNLIGDVYYKKFFEYAAGLILIVIVISPVLSLFGDEDDLLARMGYSLLEEQAEETKKEIEMFGEKREKEVWERYAEKIKEDAAKECGVTAGDCEVSMREGQIQKIEITLPEGKEITAKKRKQLALRYGVEEDGIFILTGEDR